jgi:hypothetical protein
MVKKTILLLVAIMFSCSPYVLAHDGEHYFPADQIAPITGVSGAWIDYHVDIGTKDPARFIEHSFVWAEEQGFEAYEHENAFEGLAPSGMEIDLSFYGYDKTVWSPGAYSEDQDSTFWYNDMPYAYIDTSFLDNSEEPTIGLGSGYWYLASPEYVYYAATYLREPYTAEFDDFKVTVTRTHFHEDYPPLLCSGKYDDPWCRFEDGYPEKGSVKVVPSWAGSAPGQYWWEYPDYDFPFVDPKHNGEGCRGITCSYPNPVPPH